LVGKTVGKIRKERGSDWSWMTELEEKGNDSFGDKAMAQRTGWTAGGPRGRKRPGGMGRNKKNFQKRRNLGQLEIWGKF